MKKLTLLFISALFTLTVSAQTESETLKQANDLIADKKYESAFKLLDSFDPKNTLPDIVLLKEHIALDYFVSSIMHQAFGLKDLEKHEDIADYRGKEGDFVLQLFQIDSVLENLVKQYPTNCKLYRGLGEFYYKAHASYGGRWLKSDHELFKLIETNYTKAVEGNCADQASYYTLGYVALAQERYTESIPHFLTAIEMDQNDPSAHYNLAYAYLYVDDRQHALKYAKNALDLYTDRTYKSDAARMMGQIYSELEDYPNATLSYELADNISPANYYTLRPLLGLYVMTNHAKVKEATKAFFNLSPANPTIYNDLEKIYYRNKKENELIVFYEERLPDYKNDAKVLGSLNFYLAKLYLTTDKKRAKTYFTAAKETLSTVYGKDHGVFKAIEEGIKQAEK